MWDVSWTFPAKNKGGEKENISVLVIYTKLWHASCHLSQVVDRLCMVNRLSDKGYDSDDSETALHLFENNIEKVNRAYYTYKISVLKNVNNLGTLVGLFPFSIFPFLIHVHYILPKCSL